MIIKIIIGLIVFVGICLYLLGLLEKKISRKTFDNNFKKFKNGNTK